MYPRDRQVYRNRMSFDTLIDNGSNDMNKEDKKWKWINAYGVSICIGAAWSLSAEATSKVEETFNKPYFLTYIHSFFNLLLCSCIYGISLIIKSPILTTRRYPSFVSMMELGKLLIFVLLDFTSNFLFTAALSLTVTSSALSLEQLTSIYIALLSFFFLGETFSIPKIIGLIIALGGGVLVTQADNDSHSTASNPFLGDMIVILGVSSAAAIYMVLFKKVYGDISPADLIQFFIWKSFVFCVIFAPGFYIADITGFETFEWPNGSIWSMLVLVGLLAFTFNVCLNWSIIKISPLHARLSILIGLPISFLIDVWGNPFDVMQFSGIALVIGGLIVHFSFESSDKEIKHQQLTEHDTDDVFV